MVTAGKDVAGQLFVHGEHGQRRLEERLQLVVQDDLALVLGVLQLVRLDVHP